MEANTNVSYTPHQRKTQENKRREKQIYLELWNALSDLLLIPPEKLTQEDIVQMNTIAQLMHQYESRLYPMPEK